MSTLLVTNDFPPRPGGIQQFVHNLALRLPPDELVVYCSDHQGSAAFDAEQPFEVIRESTGMLLPTPGVARRAASIAKAHGCDAVWFGASAPLGLLAQGLRSRTGIERAVGLTHGHEVGWAALPGARTALRRIADGCDVLTYLGEYTRSRLAKALGDRTRLERLAPGVDVDSFHPSVDGSIVRKQHGLVDRPVIVCVSRLVPRKGQDTLIRALPLVRQAVPDAALLIVGGGPYRSTLEGLAQQHGVADAVTITGAVPWSELPAHFAAGDVFAMPCRTRRGGLDVEGLGIVYLEGSATGLPVIAGDSGGAPDAVREGETGYVVGTLTLLVQRLVELLGDPAAARAMGEAGRAWTEREWRWEHQAARLSALLHS
ncbi:phosphatidylinositol alpha-1,6-mannosyltransferase [Allocatelliglobosispora scoriae]|uniref:Phosphatidylinositol alpha-1,6-mannosyltransferase n=1 Tax=Allocatelliglobosispora scoriae TaxID=643052 RepID=A0A841BK31_9ACTN|nr:glycosyltransferase family 4 protein [Allocatelliglobosispora scoriae]MBB5869457.1 phosphatidylinositol alpha-1,6-mannosyltransferase [Allocatelliglobosispora scoriae]